MFHHNHHHHYHHHQHYHHHHYHHLTYLANTCQTLSCDYTLDLPNFEHVSEDGKDFIKKLLVLEPSERQTAAQTLQHPWLTDNRVGLSDHLDFCGEQ